jgi:CBS domain-containing protein
VSGTRCCGGNSEAIAAQFAPSEEEQPGALGAKLRAQSHPMKRNEPVSKIMSSRLVTVHHGEPVSKVRQLIREHGVHHIPVVSGQKLVGLISNSDVLRISFGDAFQTDERTVDATLDHTMTLEQLMKKDPVCVRENAPIREAAQILAQGEYHSVPVVSDGHKLVGMVTSTDLIRYLLEQY